MHEHNDKIVSENISYHKNNYVFLNRSYCSVVSVPTNVTYQIFYRSNKMKYYLLNANLS